MSAPPTPIDPVAHARAARRSAQAFAAIVRRFGTEMPGNLDRFHDTMQAFRAAASQLTEPAPRGAGAAVYPLTPALTPPEPASPAASPTPAASASVRVLARAA